MKNNTITSKQKISLWGTSIAISLISVCFFIFPFNPAIAKGSCTQKKCSQKTCNCWWDVNKTSNQCTSAPANTRITCNGEGYQTPGGGCTYTSGTHCRSWCPTSASTPEQCKHQGGGEQLSTRPIKFEIPYMLQL